MDNLIVKEVLFNGATLMAVQEKVSGKIHVGVNWICKGLGLTDDQMKNERKKVQNDLVLSKGGSNLTLPTKGGNQETICIELDFLPLWLAKISITPKMQEDQPELTERLVEYQLKAKDVLAAVFLPKAQTNKAAKTNLSSVNNAVKIIGGYMKQAGISEDIQLLTVKGLYAKAEVYLPIDIQADKVYYDAKQIARRFGVTTKTGKPAYHAISAIIRQLDIFSDEVKEVWETNGSWQGVVKKYSDSAIEKVEDWLKENKYPSVVADGNKNFYVFYEIAA